MTPRRRSGRGVPPLRNEDVTGLDEARQDAVIRESGTDPDRGDAAREFYAEQQDQAGETRSSAARRGVTRKLIEEGSGEHHGTAEPGTDTELRKHWDPKRRGKG
jgi:hypothetical protein